MNIVLSQKKMFYEVFIFKLNYTIKICKCSKGKILDVVIDLRKIQKHLKVFQIILSQKNALGLFIPRGLRMHIIVMRGKMLFIIR